MQKIEVFEVGPRDGFQNQKAYIPAENKIKGNTAQKRSKIKTNVVKYGHG